MHEIEPLKSIVVELIQLPDHDPGAWTKGRLDLEGVPGGLEIVDRIIRCAPSCDRITEPIEKLPHYPEFADQSDDLLPAHSSG